MIRLFKHYIPHAVLLLAALDLCLLFIAGEAAWHLRATQISIEIGGFNERAFQLFGFVLVLWTAMIAVGVYSSESLRRLRLSTARLMVAISLGIIALSVINFIIPGATFWRSTLFYAMVGAAMALFINRIFIGKFLGMSAFERRVVVMGAGARAERLKTLGEDPDSGFSPVAFIAMNEGMRVLPDATPRMDIEDLGPWVESQGAREVVLALEERRNSLPLKDLLRIKTMGFYVHDYSSFIERETGRVDLDSVNPSWLIFSDGFASSRLLSGAIKRLFDIMVSAILLIVTMPIIALFALAVKLDSKGPAFFKQSRVGLFGETIYVVKLRTMRTDAEKDGVKWAEKNDPRITRLGRFLRKVRIDELPQTWSVLKGEMSFVGPRPEVPKFVNDLTEHLPYYAERHMVKPGITGWAQINYPYGASIEDSRHKLEYDLYYTKNYTPFLDLLILLQTLRVILWPEGAR